MGQSLEPFIFGLPPRIPGYALRATRFLFEATGENTGNLAFQHAIDTHLQGNRKVVSWGAAPAEVNAAGDVGVIPAANQLGRHVDYGRLAERVAATTRKFVMLGLGAQSTLDGTLPDVPDGTIAWVRTVAERAVGDGPNIAVRGPFSHAVLAAHGLGERAVVLGCPSLFVNPAPRLGKLIAGRLRRPRRVAVAAGHESWRHLARMEASLGRIVTETGGSYVGQSAFAMVRLTRGEAAQLPRDKLAECRDFVCPDMELPAFVAWTVRHGNVFFDVNAWMEHYRHVDFVVGARIHGVMLALQIGVPALCVVHDSRTRELCETMGVPFVLARDHPDGLATGDLADLVAFDADAFDDNRRRLADAYDRFLRANGIAPSPWLGEIARGG